MGDRPVLHRPLVDSLLYYSGHAVKVHVLIAAAVILLVTWISSSRVPSENAVVFLAAVCLG